MAEILLKRIKLSASSSNRFFYKKDTDKSVYSIIVSTGMIHDDFNRPTDHAIEIYEADNNTYVVYHDGNGGLNNTVLSNEVLLYVREQNRAFYTWSKTAKQVFLRTYTAPDVALLPKYERSPSLLVDSFCHGTTFKSIYNKEVTVPDLGNTDSSQFGQVTEVLVENAASCGYAPPPSNLVVTEKIKIRIDKNCYKNPVLLLWKNKFGGFDRFMFHHTQTVTKKTESLGSVDRNFYYLENQNVLSKGIGVVEENTMVVGADNLSLDNYNAIVNHLPGSPQVYIQEKNGRLTSVDIRPSSYSYDTAKVRGSIEIELILPESFTIKN